jgi:two-component system, NarL family, response regulator LiaR
MEPQIRVLIADDHTIVRHGLRLMLELKPGIEVVGEAQDGAEAITLAGALKPDVIIMDLEMPRVSGLQAIAEIHARMPEIHILVLTSYTDSEKITSAIKNGAVGYLLKDSPPGELIQAIREVAQGHINLPPEIAQKLVQGLQQSSEAQRSFSPLTNRELEVLRLAACGMSNPEIAGKLVVSEGTVRFHFSNIFNKLQVNNRSQAIVHALRRGLVDLGEGA